VTGMADPVLCVRCGRHPAVFMLRTREATGFCASCYVAALQAGIRLGPVPASA
jgi:NMD protein affecting ribosome stability and mRNA decay